MTRVIEGKDPGPRRIFIISGVSGAGRSQALKCFEDFGFFCVDNLPLALLPRFVEHLEKTLEMRRVALGMDIREGDSFRGFLKALQPLRDGKMPFRVLFLDASDQVLVQRFSETRHRHPLGTKVSEALQQERNILVEVKAAADKVIDTSNMTLGELKETLSQTLELTRSSEMIISVLSFGYKYGLPMDADVVMDVRFLPNPNYVKSLKRETGLQPKVRRFLNRQEGARGFIRDYYSLLARLLPGYVREGKSYLTLAVGCTGGRHRSVYAAHELARSLRRAGYAVREFHRDIDK
ncbi:MAG: RNase adapter RapZ [Elusimicrobiota bacterium]